MWAQETQACAAGERNQAASSVLISVYAGLGKKELMSLVGMNSAY
jgi:hypothetical protein